MNGNSSWRGSPLSERDRVVDGFLATSCLIREPLALCTDKSAIGAGLIVDAELDPIVVAEIELGQIPINVLPINVLIDADEAALEHGKEALKRIGVYVAAYPFLFRVIDALVLAMRHEMPIGHRAIRIKLAVAIKVPPERRAHRVVVEEHRTDRAAALDKTEYLPILAKRRILRAAGLRRAGDERLIGLDDLAKAADRPAAAAAVHRQPDAVHQEPRGFHAAAERALYLAGRDAFLASANQVDRLKPYPHRHMARLEDGAHAHRERLTAWAAIPKAGAGRFAFGARGFANRAAMRAYGAIRPKPRLDVFDCGVLVGEMFGIESGIHGEPRCRSPFYRWIVLCQV
jgi:hypothetical protein